MAYRNIGTDRQTKRITERKKRIKTIERVIDNGETNDRKTERQTDRLSNRKKENKQICLKQHCENWKKDQKKEIK